MPGVLWQRRQFHLQQNAQAYVPRLAQREEVGRAIRSIFLAPDRVEAEQLLAKTMARHTKTAPELARWMETNLPEGFTVFALPACQRRMLRTSNLLEALNKELRRRTRVATLFPNEASLLRLVTAVLIEFRDEWETGRIYLPRETSRSAVTFKPSYGRTVAFPPRDLLPLSGSPKARDVQALKAVVAASPSGRLDWLPLRPPLGSWRPDSPPVGPLEARRGKRARTRTDLRLPLRKRLLLPAAPPPRQPRRPEAEQGQGAGLGDGGDSIHRHVRADRRGDDPGPEQ